MNTNTTFINQVIKRHALTGKRTVVKKFAFNDTVQAMNLARELNAQHEGTFYTFTVATAKVGK
jgi:Arc/MetJ family transcription regulator